MAELPKDEFTACSAFFFGGSLYEEKILKQLSDIFRKPAKPWTPGEKVAVDVGGKYRAFQELLARNNEVLRLMADIKSYSSGGELPIGWNSGEVVHRFWKECAG